MNLPSKKPGTTRSSFNPNTPGFSLLETLLALAILALVLGNLYPVISHSMLSPKKAQIRLDLTEFARSTLEEYSITYPKMAQSGSYRNQWSWVISEKPVPGLAATRYDALIDLVEISISANTLDSTNSSVKLKTVIARKARRK